MDISRREMFAAAGAVAATSALGTRAFGGWEPSERYPDPAIKSLDPSFNKYRLFNAGIERLATGMRWCRRAGLVRRCALPDLERHPQQRPDALG